jgi:hypothetical protein
MRVRYSLATLLVLLAFLPPIIAFVWHVFPPLYEMAVRSFTYTRSVQVGLLGAAVVVIVWACRTEKR